MSNNAHGTGLDWTNPAPAGLVELAVACYSLSALFAGRVEANAAPLLGIWLLGGFLVQVIVAIVELRSGNLLSGNVFTFFSCFLMFVSGVSMIFKFNMATQGIALDATIDGWAWMALTIAIIGFTPAYLKSANGLLSIVILCLDVALPLITIKDLGLLAAGSAASHAVPAVIGWALLLAGTVALYIASAIIVNRTFGKVVFKLPGPMLKGK